MISCKKMTLVVDYLNIGLIPIIYKLDIKKNILLIYLFNSNIFVEKFIKFILKTKNINYKFIPLNSKRTYKKHSAVINVITLNFIKNFNFKKYPGNNYLDFLIGNIFYKKAIRIVSQYIFIKELNLKDPEIYFNKSRVSSHIAKNYHFKKLNYYRAFGALDSKDYFNEHNEEKILFFRSIKNIFKMLGLLLLSLKNSLPEELKFKPLFFIHPIENSFLKIVSKKLKETNHSYLIFDTAYKIKYNNKKYDIRCLNIFDIFSVFKESNKLLSDLKSSNFLNFQDKILIIRECFNIFYIDNFIKKMRPPLFYSKYESTKCILFQDIAKNYNCVTMASTFSFGYFPQKYEGGHQAKFCDIFFVWGKKHSDLILNSNDKSRHHIISGYEQERHILKKKHTNYKKLICFCDNTFANDLYLNKREVFRTLKFCIKFAQVNNYKIVIKTKKYKDVYKNIMNNNSSIIIEIDDNLGSIQQYHKNTIFIGYSLYTLGIQALKQKNIALFFDQHGLIWDEISLILKDYIFKNENEFLFKMKNISKLNPSENIELITKIIDCDDCDSNKKIADYIVSYLNNFDTSKNKAIEKTNKIYIKKWGDIKIIFNNNHLNSLNNNPLIKHMNSVFLE